MAEDEEKRLYFSLDMQSFADETELCLLWAFPIGEVDIPSLLGF